MVKNTVIRISVDTRDQLKEIGKKGETYDGIVARLLGLYRLRKHKELKR